jgi:hypothetical protein
MKFWFLTAPVRVAAVLQEIPSIIKGSASAGSTLRDAGFDILREEILESPTSPVRVANLDLGAVRREQHQCWQVKTGTSINDDPVSVAVLKYGEI